MNEIRAGTLLLLVRHGETEWNRDQRVQGHTDVPLSERGVEQARRLAERLAGEPLHAVYTSDLSRARLTAEILAGHLPVEADPRLREAHLGAFQGLTVTEIQASYPEAYHAWRTDPLRGRPPGGETVEELRERCLAALREHLPGHPGETVAVVAHGGPIRAMVCGLLDLPLDAYGRFRVENASVTRILFTERGAMLAGFNDISHLRGRTAPEHSGWEER